MHTIQLHQNQYKTNVQYTVPITSHNELMVKACRKDDLKGGEKMADLQSNEFTWQGEQKLEASRKKFVFVLLHACQHLPGNKKTNNEARATRKAVKWAV